MTHRTAQTVRFRGNAISRGSNVSRWFQENMMVVNLCSLALVAVMVGLYIVQVNATISKGYELRDLETQVHELSLLNEKMELETRQSQSLQHVSNSVKMLGFVEAEQPQYLDVRGPAYALAD